MFRYLYGYHPVLMAMTENSLVQLKKVVLVNGKHQIITARLKQLSISYDFVTIEKMNNILKTSKHQGIYGEVANYNYFSLPTLFKRLPFNKYYRVLICDRITDPHNFGAIIRTAAGNDFDGIIVLNRQQVKVNATVAKAAAGAISVIRIYEVHSLQQALNELRQKGFWTLATANESYAKPFQEINYDFHAVFIIGNEGEGVKANLLKKVDYIIKIPMSRQVESFNVSVAWGIIANAVYLQTKK